MKITIVQGAFLPVPPLLGGAVEKVWFALGREMAVRGHEVVHFSRCFPGMENDVFEAGVRYLRVHGYETPKRLWHLKLLDLAYSLRVLFQLPQADILVTNTFWLPILCRDRSRGALYVHVARFPRGQLRWYGHAAAWQTVSEPIARVMRLQEPRKAELVRVVPYPLSEVVGTVKEGKGKVVLFAGRVHPEKGLELLIRAWKELEGPRRDGWRLRLVGPWETAQGGGGKEFLKRLQDLSEGDSSIDWVGPIFDSRELGKEYARAPVFVYPSLAIYGETFGLAVLEAMAEGCVPVVSGLECFQDFVRNGINGLVFNHEGAEAALHLAQALERILREEDRRVLWAEEAIRTAERYTLDQVADQYLQDFERVQSVKP